MKKTRRNMLAGGRSLDTAKVFADSVVDAETGIEPIRSFQTDAIASGIRATSDGNAPLSLYRRLLGEAWEALPPAVAAMHDITGESVALGRADIERGHGLPARLVAAVVGFPKAARQADVRVRFSVVEGIETWTRTFGGRTFRSRQCAGRGPDAHLLAEDFGPFRILMALEPEDGRLKLVVRSWRFFGVALPRSFAPGGNTYEEQRNGRFHFHVEVKAPLIGLIVRYQGWLVPDDTPNRSS
jgi:hypothetical protein